MIVACETGTVTDDEILTLLQGGLPPCIKTLGGTLVEASRAEGRAVMTFRAVPEFCHSGTIVQGGFITGMLDAAMSHALVVKSNLTVSVPTLELKVSFFAPGAPGLMRAEGHVVHMGRSIAFLEGSLFNEDGRLVARASSTNRLTPAKSRTEAPIFAA